MILELAGIAPPPVPSLDDVARALADGAPSVLVVGAGASDPAALAALGDLTRARPEIGVVLLVDELNVDVLHHALRAGVRDTVTLDAGVEAVRAAIERVAGTIVALARRAESSTATAMGRLVVAFSTKGGVGKSVVATNVACVLAQHHPGEVVIVDGDLQFGDVAVLLGVPPTHTALDVVHALDTVDRELLDGMLGTHDASGLRVLCAPIEPAAAERISAAALMETVTLLRAMFGFVVVDLPPQFDDRVVALIEEADDVLLVASMDIPSVKNLKVGLQTLDLLALAGPKLRLVLNRANARVNLDVGDVERALGVPAELRVPSDIAVPQAVNRGVPVVVDRPRAPAAIALRGIAGVIAGRGPAVERTEPFLEPRRRGARRSE
jgi:pilus assembly protein CpaE